MHAGMALDIAKDRSLDALLGTGQERPGRQVPDVESSDGIDRVGLRTRIARLLGSFRVLGAGRRGATGS